MVKKFDYRGIPLKDLEGMDAERWFGLFTARQRRSLSRGLSEGKRRLTREIRDSRGGGSAPVRTHVRDLIVLPYMVGARVAVFSGKEFREVAIVPEMIGRYLGEFVITNKRVNHGAPGVGASRSSLYVPLK